MKKKIISILTAVMVVALGCIMTANVTRKVKADEPATYTMEKGTSLRLVSGKIDGTETDIHDGMRFRLLLNESAKNEVDKGDAVLSFIIAPQNVFVDAETQDKDLLKYVTEDLKKQVIKVQKDKVYWDDEKKVYAVNGVLCNMLEGNLARSFNAMVAIKKGGTTSYAVREDVEDDGARSLYETVNNVLLSDKEDSVVEMMTNSGMTYNTWYGKEDYPIQVNTPAQYNKLAEIIDAGKLSLATNGNVEVKSEVYKSAEIEDARATIEENTDIQKATVYTVTFMNGDVVLESKQVKEGVMPTYTGKTPTKDADAQYTYTFDGCWDKDFAEVNGDTTYTAKFSSVLRSYTVKFVSEGTELQSSEVAYGSMPEYKGTTPTKTADAQYTYTFDDWDKALAEVNGDATYTAKFSSVLRSYTVKFVSEGVELQSSEVAYGSMPEYKGATPTKTATKEFTYTFDGWDKDFAEVNGDATYTATFSSVKNQYTVTFDADGGSAVTAKTVDYGTAFSTVLSGVTTSKDGFDFDSWKLSDGSALPDTVTDDVTIKAVWVKAKAYEVWADVSTTGATAYNNYNTFSAPLSVVDISTTGIANGRTGNYYKIANATSATALAVAPSVSYETLRNKYENGYLVFEMYFDGAINNGVMGTRFGIYGSDNSCIAEPTVQPNTWVTYRLAIANMIKDETTFGYFTTVSGHMGKIISIRSENITANIYVSQMFVVNDESSVGEQVVYTSDEGSLADVYKTDDDSLIWRVNDVVVDKDNFDLSTLKEGDNTLSISRQLGSYALYNDVFSCSLYRITKWQEVDAANTTKVAQYGSDKSYAVTVVNSFNGYNGKAYRVANVNSGHGTLEELSLKVQPAHSKAMLQSAYANGYLVIDYYVDMTVKLNEPFKFAVSELEAGVIKTTFKNITPPKLNMWNKMYIPVSYFINNYDAFNNLDNTNLGKLFSYYCGGNTCTVYLGELKLTNEQDYAISDFQGFGYGKNYGQADNVSTTYNAPDRVGEFTYVLTGSYGVSIKLEPVISSETLNKKYSDKYLTFDMYIANDSALTGTIEARFAFDSDGKVTSNGYYSYNEWHTVQIPIKTIIDNYDSFANVKGTGHDGKMVYLPVESNVVYTIYLTDFTIQEKI